MKNNKKIFPIIFLVIGYLTNVVYVALNGMNMINSDSASELILSKLLNKTGGIVTDQWYYSTELRVVNTQLVYKIALRIFPNNWHMVRVFSVAVFLLILVAALLYLAWAADLGTIGIWAAGAAIWPFGQWYTWNVIYCSYYIPHIVFSVLSIALILHMIKGKKKLNYVLGIILVLAGFLSGLGGQRQLMVCYVPLLLAMCILFLIYFRGYVPFTRKAYRSEGKEVQAAVLTVFVTISAVAGYLINSRIFSQLYHFTNQSDTTWQQLQLTKAINVIADLAGLFGWQSFLPIMSVAGFENIFALFLGIAIFYAILWCLYHFMKLTVPERILTLYVICTIFVDGLIFSQSSVYNESYWIPIIPFMIMMLVVKGKAERRLYAEEEKNANRMIWTKELALVIMFVVVSVGTMQSPYPDSVPTGQNIKEAANWLSENGYTQGYANFWNSNVITELTSGQIEMWTVNNDFTTLNQYEWLQDVSHADMENGQPDGKFFIIGTISEMPGEGALIESQLVYSDETYYIYAFDSLEQYRSLVQSQE